MREIGGVILAKAAAMGTVVIAVLHAHLSTFQQALIIAATSAILTGIFTVAAAWITIRATRPMRDEVKQVHEQVLSDNE